MRRLKTGGIYWLLFFIALAPFAGWIYKLWSQYDRIREKNTVCSPGEKQLPRHPAAREENTRQQERKRCRI